MKEVWKSIKDFEEYKVSNFGRVFGIKGHMLSPHINIWGYYQVTLRKLNRSYTKKIHRLVLETFIPNPSNKKEGNHIDGDKLNNCVDNLEWVTRWENMEHARKTGLVKYKSSRKSDLSQEDVQRIRKLVKNGIKLKPVAKHFGISIPYVSEIINGKKRKDVG